MSKKVHIIGSGFSGISAASHLAKAGYDVTVLEKNESTGGRARVWSKDGFRFDLGPSWYWMPDVFEKYFAEFGKKTSDYYDLIRLDPSYQIYFKDDSIDIPSNLNKIKEVFESFEPGAAGKLQVFLDDAKYKYEVGINDLVYQPSIKYSEYLDKRLLMGLLKMDVLKSYTKYTQKHFKSDKILQILNFPILFLGAKPENTPALYSLMNYADIALGTWYPIGGMHSVIEGMMKNATELGVKFEYNQEVKKIKTENGKAKTLTTDSDEFETDIVIGSSDYAHTESLLDEKLRSYNSAYWNSRTFAPSALIFYLGLSKKLNNLEHHNLFFDEDFDIHAQEIYDTKTWPTKPLFYVCCPSKTDSSVAPEGKENLFILMPLAPGIEDTEAQRSKYFDLIMNRLEKRTKNSIVPSIEVKRSYCINDFVEDYNSFKGNAYGLANTLKQTAVFKPKMKSKKVSNLYFTGQLTVPGPGVPPALISGEVVSKLVQKYH